MNGMVYQVNRRKFDTSRKAIMYAYRVLKKDGMRIAIKQVSPYGIWYYGLLARVGDTRILYRETYGKMIVSKDGSIRGI